MPDDAFDDVLARLTEDLVADHRASALEALSALGDADRRQLLELLTVARRLKTTYREEPPVSEEFLQRLDAGVRQTIEREFVPAGRSAFRTDDTVATSGVRAASSGAPSAFAASVRRFVGSLLPPTGTGRWRLVGVAAVGLVLMLQVQLLLHVRRLETQNRDLASRMEQVTQYDRMRALSLGLGQDARDLAGPGGPRGRPPSDDSLWSIDIQRKIDRRIEELQAAVKTKTGAEREHAQALLRELQELVRR